VLTQADTLDFLVMDVAQAWERYQHEQAEKKAKAKAQGLPPPAPDIPINTLQAAIERVRK